MRIAIYDMDKTITRRATYAAFLANAVRTRAPWRLLFAPVVLATTASYAFKLIDRTRLKTLNHALLLGPKVAGDAARALAESFADTTITHNLRPGAAEQIARDRAAGCRLIMATASYAFYARAIAARLGFDAVVATECVTDADGRVLAKIAGENCYGAAKLALVEAWFAAEGLARADVEVRAYSDHVSDAPLLGWADEAFAVNPHAPLLALANLRGWRIVNWR